MFVQKPKKTAKPIMPSPTKPMLDQLIVRGLSVMQHGNRAVEIIVIKQIVFKTNSSLQRKWSWNKESHN